jgi:hypothetical protein
MATATVNPTIFIPLKPAPVFPRSAIVGSLGNLARTLSEGTEVSEEFIFAVALAYFGGITSGELKLRIGLESETRLYVILLGESARAKKSTAVDRVDKFFQSIQSPFQWKSLSSVGSAEGLAKELQRTPRVILNYDELRSLVDKTKIRGSVLMPTVASLFERHNYSHTTKNESVDIKNGRLSLVACCTIGTYENLWTSDAINLGLPNRLFIVHADAKPSVPWPKEIDEGKMDLLRKHIQSQLQRATQTFERTAEAEVLWNNWQTTLPHSEHAKRLDTIGFRLMPVLALTMDKAVVDADVVRHVIDILNYELEVRILYDPIDSDDKIASIETKIRRQLQIRGFLTKRELRRFTNADRIGVWAFEKALENLAKGSDPDIQKVETADGREGYRLSSGLSSVLQ